MLLKFLAPNKSSFKQGKQEGLVMHICLEYFLGEKLEFKRVPEFRETGIVTEMENG